MLAYDYPILGAFWTMLWIFLWVLWFFLLFRIIVDIFRSDDLGGWGKAAWLLFVIILPFLGVFVYLIARGAKMGQRDMEQAQAQQAQFHEYIRSHRHLETSTADELTKLADLKQRGVIADAEFAAQKAKMLSYIRCSARRLARGRPPFRRLIRPSLGARRGDRSESGAQWEHRRRSAVCASTSPG